MARINDLPLLLESHSIYQEDEDYLEVTAAQDTQQAVLQYGHSDER